MEISISRFRDHDLDTVYEIQRAAYKPLYDKYRDDKTNPYMESKETVFRKYTRAGTVGYIFFADGVPCGAVRINIDEVSKIGRVSALCVLPEFQGRGIAQNALLEIERMHADINKWCLDTIQQEPGNCHLYEKLGYKKTGKTETVSEKMTLVFYEKNL
ncbi:MAG: GNAT family N-acetyltransferase [Ruminococcus sp.]|nr:GNAT family N-acetyltransferase [Ruminococcus sp.]MBR1753141.1 GNAT family N-acetyltransferase [Ruminococcus sp.]